MIRNIAAEAWKKFADRDGPRSSSCVDVCVETYYKALDAEKNSIVCEMPPELANYNMMGCPLWWERAFQDKFRPSVQEAPWRSSSIMTDINCWIDARQWAMRSTPDPESEMEVEKAQLWFKCQEDIPLEIKVKWADILKYWKREWSRIYSSVPKQLPNNQKKIWINCMGE
eukprot:scaffold30178_cov47-Prasinocladus_malaysianus.AAC.1